MKRKFALLFFSAPIFWSIVFNFNKFSLNHLMLINDPERITRINQVRQSGVSRLLVNKSFIATDESFNYLSLYAPRIYFQGGDGQITPQTTSPFFEGLFFFWIIGIVNLIKNKDKKYLLTFLLAVPGYIFASRSMILLLPIAMVYLHISILGTENFKFKKKIIVFVLLMHLYMTLKYFIYG